MARNSSTSTPSSERGFLTHIELAGKRDRVSTSPAQVYRILNEAVWHGSIFGRAR